MVKMLCSLGCEVNRTDYAGDTPLHDASRFGHKRIVVSLLEAGADLTLTNKARASSSVATITTVSTIARMRMR